MQRDKTVIGDVTAIEIEPVQASQMLDMAKLGIRNLGPVLAEIKLLKVIGV